MGDSDINSLDFLSPLPGDDFKLHKLTERSSICKIVKLCVKTTEKGSEEDVILQSSEVKVNCNHEDYPNNTMYVYARNIHCSDWNDHMLNSLKGDMNAYVSVDSRKDYHTNLVSVPFPTKLRHIGNLCQVLNIRIGV